MTFILSTTILTSFGQDSSKTKVYHNEFGIDATAFVKQFLNFSFSEYPDYYFATYYLTYRRHFKCGNIRFAIGGDFSDYNKPPSWSTDSNDYHYTSYDLTMRIGWEFYNDIGKRWQVFYGLDFRPSLSYIKNDVPYWSGGYANGIETRTETYGLAPLLGFRFKLTNRISISTETSFSVNWQQSDERKYFIPVTSAYPPLPDEVSPTVKKVFSSFAQPVSLHFTFDI